MPGELANVVSGRVANLLNLQGPNYATTVASSMAAIWACSYCKSPVDLMLAGASDRTMDPATLPSLVPSAHCLQAIQLHLMLEQMALSWARVPEHWY